MVGSKSISAWSIDNETGILDSHNTNIYFYIHARGLSSGGLGLGWPCPQNYRVPFTPVTPKYM